MTDQPVTTGVSPNPTDEEMAAIQAAIEFSWPRPAQGAPRGPELPVWRFSGRWWNKPMPQARQRP